eukprot:12111130-Alexandrium_andersonii.AAC.1
MLVCASGGGLCGRCSERLANARVHRLDRASIVMRPAASAYRRLHIELWKLVACIAQCMSETAERGS